MPLTKQSTEELFQQSEKNFLQFLRLFFKMQISCLQIMAYFPSAITNQKYAEKQLVESLSLIDNLVMHFNSRDFLICHYVDHDSYIYLKNEIEEIEYLILEFKQYLSKYSFTVHFYMDQSDRLINQISRYFYQDYVKVIVIDNQLPKPWLAPSSATG